MSNVSVELIKETNSDLTVVNSARVSFAKESTWANPDTKELNEKDSKLIQYLAKHNHWTTFAHCNEVYLIILSNSELLQLYKNLKSNSGITIVPYEKSNDYIYVFIKGSLIAWTREVALINEVALSIEEDLCARYPIAAKALGLTSMLRRQTFDSRSIHEVGHVSYLNDDWIAENASNLKLDVSEHRGTTLELLSSLTSVTLRLNAPIFVARQLGKHQVGFVWNEVSRRYVDDNVTFYEPDDFRGKPKPDPVTGKVNNKQGSSDETIGYDIDVLGLYGKNNTDSYEDYKAFLKAGVAPEDARMLLPQSMMTQWYWTGSLLDWLRVYNLRIKEDTQAKTREVVKLIDLRLNEAYPKTWRKLKETYNAKVN